MSLFLRIEPSPLDLQSNESVVREIKNNVPLSEAWLDEPPLIGPECFLPHFAYRLVSTNWPTSSVGIQHRTEVQRSIGCLIASMIKGITL